jgi:hypothetical protein
MRGMDDAPGRPAPSTSVSSMVTEALSQLSAVFRRRFLFNALLPTLVFVTALTALTVSSVGPLRRIDQWWSHLDVLAQAVAVLGYLAVVWFLAGAVASQWRGIVRLFEGYPAMRVLKKLTPGIAWHRRQARLMWVGDDAAEQDGNDEDAEWPNAVLAYPRYPLIDDSEDGRYNEADILPTRLGNILLAAERYPLSRYGMDAIYFWPRLFPLLPQQFQQDYEKFLQQYELPLVVAFQASVAATAGGIVIVATQGPWWLFLAWFGGGHALAYLFYSLSLTNAEELGEQQRTAFDLYRHLLLEQWPTPADVKNEKDAFRKIQEFIVSSLDPEWQKPQLAHRRRHRTRGPSQGAT